MTADVRGPAVLVAGGSLVGLCTALFLARRGVATLLVERHPGTAVHPRTPGYNARSMELFRAAGVARAVRQAGPWQLDGSGLLAAATLTSEQVRWLEPLAMRGPTDDFSGLTPAEPAVLSQDLLEPVLRRHAEAAGAVLRFGTMLESFHDDGDRVTAVLRDLETGATREATVDYLVAADGADSAIRARLGIGRDGPGVLDHQAGITVRADLSAVRHRFAVGKIDNPEVSAMVRIVGDRLTINVGYRPGDGESIDQFTPDRCVALARAVVGIPRLAATPLGVSAWQPSAAVARRFSAGRVFLAGDAAHVMPPSGAFGANTGIQDAYNLAWKLALVLDGSAPPRLLDSYHTERRPVAEMTVGQALHRGRAWFGEPYPVTGAMLDDVTVMFGYRYGPGPVTEDPGAPSGEPGTRLPHAWVTHGGQRMSTVDLWAAGAVLLTGPGGAPWRDSVPAGVEVAELGPDDWDRVGDGGTGAMLIRPDGFIAWRSESSPRDTAVRDAVAGMLAGSTDKEIFR
ncbi:MAG TPA: FAD-dependent oxidoreductase [Amycolatopsis sp.]|jgi:putative polyketide hydroxylase